MKNGQPIATERSPVQVWAGGWESFCISVYENDSLVVLRRCIYLVDIALSNKTFIALFLVKNLFFIMILVKHQTL